MTVAAESKDKQDRKIENERKYKRKGRRYSGVF